jgi:hypothetical protein
MQACDESLERHAVALLRYSPWIAPPILVPLGPKRGASVLPLTKSGFAVGGFPTSLIKGKSLVIPRYRKEFGVNDRSNKKASAWNSRRIAGERQR